VGDPDKSQGNEVNHKCRENFSHLLPGKCEKPGAPGNNVVNYQQQKRRRDGQKFSVLSHEFLFFVFDAIFFFTVSQTSRPNHAAIPPTKATTNERRMFCQISNEMRLVTNPVKGAINRSFIFVDFWMKIKSGEAG